MKLSILTALSLALAAPAAAQSVSAGVDHWQKGDHAAAIAVWAPLAARGDPDAAFNLGQAYRLGKGVPLDLARAQTYLEAAARKSHVDAATTLGLLLFQNGNRTGAMRWLRQAADAGEPRAMLILGTALFNGDGIARDPVRAYALVSRAAAQGLVAARETLLELDENLPLDQRQKGVALAKSMVAVKPAPAKPAAAVAKTAAPPPSVAPAPLAKGDWRIQLGAFGQRATAEALAGRVRGKTGARQAFFVPAGKVVRLQIGPYATRGAANTACATLAPLPCFAVAAR